MSELRGPRKLFLLHLSDIHLRKEEISSAQDLDLDLRARVLADVARAELPTPLRIDAVLITGDLAFGGNKVEYTSARGWLRTLCRSVNCPESHVWVVPGNHDVDREVITRSVTIRDQHAAIRGDADPANALAERLREEAAAQLLLSPFVEYNRFARLFQNETTPSSVFWESSDEEDDLILNDGSCLRLRGINSSIISDKSGDNGPPQGPATEVVGLVQVQLRDEQEGICYLTLCHHPPQWMVDADVVTDHLTSRARIQLYGHKHKQRVRKIDNSVVLGAGALHPNRGETDWNPRYNILSLEILGDASDRRLRVEVFQRAWKAIDTHFGKEIDADGNYPKVFELQLASWSPPAKPQPKAPAREASSSESTSLVTSTRDLVFGLLRLTYPVRMGIFVRLQLLEAADDGVSDSELVKRAILRARERGQLADLENELKAAMS